MPKLNLPPTKSNLLGLRRQLAFAMEGYDLLEQKRQLLMLELMARLERARQAEHATAAALRCAFAALQEALLDAGTYALDQALLGVPLGHQVRLTHQHLMGIRLPRVSAQLQPVGPRFGIGGTSATMDLALRRWVELLPLVIELAELQTAVLRLTRELRKTQRRCNALSKIFIPDCRETVAYIVGALEERERESFVILKMIRDRLAHQRSL